MTDNKLLFPFIRSWAHNRGLIENGNPQGQMLKLMEETGELAHALARKQHEGICDAIGDTVVVLTILAAQLGVDIEDCIAAAYDVIKDRKGYLTKEGIFIKEEDMQ